MSRRRSALIVAALIAFLATGCTSSASDEEAVSEVATPTATSEPSASPPPPEPTESQVALPSPGATPDPTPEGLGRYLVARQGAGELWQGNGSATRALAVYDEPDGEKRMLLEVNAVDGVALPLPLFNWFDRGSPTVLRVVEGEPGDAWVRIQAPTRPHDTSVWVDAKDFEWASTTLRIEINLSGGGELAVFDGDAVLMTAPIVQGRDSRETPVHVTYLEAGLLGDVWGRSPAYGDAVLMMASFSEVLGTFGGGGSPQNFIHGTNQPSLMGQRVSSGEIRLTNDDLGRLTELVHPGVPVVMFDSSGSRAGRDDVLAWELVPAETMGFILNAGFSMAADREHPQLWIPCNEPTLVCANPEPDRSPAERSFRYAIAKDLDSEFQIPVFDEPDYNRPRTLVDINAIDGIEQLNPLYPLTVFGEPLVLRVLEEHPGGWLRVQVPTRPNESYVWVRAFEFEVRETDVFIEVSTKPTAAADGGEMTVYKRDEALFTTIITPGRDSRPTPNTTGWVAEIIGGGRLGPAYGSYVVGLGVHSEALGTFGGGGLPQLAIHGTNQPEVIGQRVDSGGVRTFNEVMDMIATLDGILGAPVFIHDQAPYMTYERALTESPGEQPARTATFDPKAEQLVPSFT